MESVYDFDEAFQTKLLNLAFNGLISPSIIDESYFQNPVFGSICKSICSLRMNYSNVTLSMLKSDLRKDDLFLDREYRKEFNKVITRLTRKIKKYEAKFITDQAFRFAKLQKYKKFFIDGIDILQSQEKDVVEKLDTFFLQDKLIDINQDFGDFYFSTITDRLRRRNITPDILKTLINPLDKCLQNGGFAREDLIVFAGLASAGKSFALLHMALMSVLQYKKVLYISLEMTTDSVGMRLDASLAGVETFNIAKYGQRIAKRLGELKAEFGDSLLLRKFPAGATTVSQIRNFLDALKFRGFVPDVLIIDYINLMRSETLTREGRHRDLGSVYVDLKGLSSKSDKNLWLITAAQSNRGGYASPIITLKDFADTFEGGMHADVVITLNRDDDEAARERMRLYVAKDRNGVDKKIISIHTNYSKGAFYSRNKNTV